jgi:hypothetical protein
VNIIQRIIILSVALFIISVGIVYAVLRQEETSEDEGSQLNPLLQQEVREELQNFRMLKRIRKRKFYTDIKLSEICNTG